MGQYYHGVILAKSINENKEIKVEKSMSSWTYNNGSKLMEHSYLNNHYVKEFEKLLANEYFGFPFAWVGDYADDKYGVDVYTLAGKYITEYANQRASERGWKPVEEYVGFGKDFVDENGDYHDVDELFDITPKETLLKEKYQYIVNLDKKMFIRMPKESKEKDKYGYTKMTIHPLPLLCAVGNQRGGGDYYGRNETLVGSWAYDRIGVTNELPSDITTELVAVFEESWNDDTIRVNDFAYKEI